MFKKTLLALSAAAFMVVSFPALAEDPVAGNTQQMASDIAPQPAAAPVKKKGKKNRKTCHCAKKKAMNSATKKEISNDASAQAADQMANQASEAASATPNAQ